ncbi:MAG: magnesium/cobalt transporter CorA [Solirubrobacterales bacterium]
MLVDCGIYRDGARRDDGHLSIEEAAKRARADDGGFVWIGLHEPEPGELEELARLFGLHELAVEDAHRAHQRPKIEDYDDGFFIVLRTGHYHQGKEEVHFGEIHIFTGPGYVISVRHGPGSELSTARARLEARPDLLRLGPAAAVWAIVDKVVDDYVPVVEGIDDDIEEVESDVFDDDYPAPTQRIYRLKREVIEFHRAVWPLLTPLDALQRGAYGGIPEELRRFFRDVQDHARRVDEQVNTQRELLTSVLEANLALVSVTQNEVVKKISAVAAIVAVPTFIASVYGMNFTHMPELDSRAGYPLALGAMGLCVLALSIFFRRIRWL